MSSCKDPTSNSSRYLTRTRKCDISLILSRLQWFFVKFRIDHKIVLVTYNPLNSYYESPLSLKSQGPGDLLISQITTTADGRAVSYKAPQL